MKRFLLPLALFAALALAAEDFAFKYKEGDMYRIVSKVSEDVYVNRALSHHADILNKIAVKVTKVDGESGYHVATFSTYETKTAPDAEVFSQEGEYPSEFWRDAAGKYRIDPEYFMPVVRDVPLFTKKSMEVGDTWTAPGEEVHDFRAGFGIPEPYRIPFAAKCAFAGRVEKEGKTYDLLTVYYSIYYEPKKPSAYKDAYPTAIMGYSDQRILWDPERGMPWSYSENFKITFTLSNGLQVEFRGKADASVVEAPPLDRAKTVEDIRKDLEEAGIGGVKVVADERGVTLVLDDILFKPDSAVIEESERSKLATIAEILRKYADRDVLVTGHAAKQSTPEWQMEVSEERAAAVAGALIDLGARAKEGITVKGVGATVPVAPDDTLEGRRLNRRVEITILEN